MSQQNANNATTLIVFGGHDPRRGLQVRPKGQTKACADEKTY